MTPKPLTRRLRAACAFLVALIGACATPEASTPLQLMRPVVLLGEVHDNEGQHRLRLQAFKTLLATGARPALAMEQFDRERQPQIDRLRAQTPRPDAAALIAAAGPSGWDWANYRPFIDLALEYDLPIVAANVSREQARAVMREGLARHGYDAVVPDTVLAAQAGDIEAGHCGMLDGPTARRMALAQVARDQTMARVLQENAARGVVLLAGNGHVRTDIGVPRWLDAPTRALSEAIGVLEEGDTLAAFDRRVFMPAQSRADPCEAMRASRPKP